MGKADKLKPCPICGSEVNMIEENIGEYTVVCHGCQVLMIADDVSSKNEATERWNNRVNEPKWIPIEQQEPPEFELVLCCILGPLRQISLVFFFFFKQKTAYEIS